MIDFYHINLICLVRDKENSDVCFKALLKTYAVDVEADDYSAMGEYASWREQMKTKPIKNVVIILGEYNKQIRMYIL